MHTSHLVCSVSDQEGRINQLIDSGMGDYHIQLLGWVLSGGWKKLTENTEYGVGVIRMVKKIGRIGQIGFSGEC